QIRKIGSGSCARARSKIRDQASAAVNSIGTRATGGKYLVCGVGAEARGGLWISQPPREGGLAARSNLTGRPRPGYTYKLCWKWSTTNRETIMGKPTYRPRNRKRLNKH